MNSKAFEALLITDGVRKVIKERVHYLRGWAIYAINVNISGSLDIVVEAPPYDSATCVLREAWLHLHPVELDRSTINVLWAIGRDLSLVGHVEERQVVDAEVEAVWGDVIAKRYLPLQLVILQLDWENTRRRKFFAVEIKQGL